jgi:hypothetical protein
MASIKHALKTRTSYTTKHGLTIPYEELRAMKRLNDQLDYYKKQLGVATGERIKIGSLANSTTKRVEVARLNVNIGRYIRATKPKKMTTLAERRIKRYEGIIRKALRKETKHEVDIPFTEKDFEMFKDVKATEKMDFGKIVNFKDNLIQTIRENFEGALPTNQIDAIVDLVNDMSAYETHRMATDNPRLLDTIYYDFDTINLKVFDIWSAMNTSMMTNEGLEKVSKVFAGVQETLMATGKADTITRHAQVGWDGVSRRK